VTWLNEARCCSNTSPCWVRVRDDQHIKNGVKYYNVVFTEAGVETKLRRRFRDFAKLHQQLYERGYEMPLLPPRSLYVRRTFSRRFQEHRRRSLEQLLRYALWLDPLLADLLELRRFLGLPSRWEFELVIEDLDLE